MSFTYNFPDQRIPESHKTLDWHKAHIVEYLSYTSTDNYAERKAEIASLYYAYSAKLSDMDKLKVQKTITERSGENFGPEYFVYPLIENKIDELVGKYRKRPLRRHLTVSDKGSVIKKLDKKLDMVTEKILREVNETMQSEIGFEPETENPEMELPDDIEEFFSKDYRTLSEETGENIINQVLIVKKEKEKIYESLKHYLISERSICFFDEKDGHPSLYIPHPLDCFYDVDPNESIQSNFNYFAFDKYMSINEVFNTFENLTEQEKKNIEGYEGYAGSGANSDLDAWFKSDGGRFRVRVVSMMWKSRKKMRFLSFINKETGNEEFKLLDETEKEYKSRSRDNIKVLEIEDIRHISMVGPDVVLEYGPLENQMQTIGNKKARFIPAISLIKNNPIGTGEIRSVAKKLKYLQDFASEILYELRITARQADGNIMAYDLAMTPKEWLAEGQARAIQKIDFHIKRDKRIFYNSKDKKSQPYASSVNVSNRGHMAELVETLGLIEDLADKISGVKSSHNPYQKAATAEISYEQDTDRIEEYFGLFDTYFETVLERMLLKAKHVYKENDTFTYFGGDNKMKFLTIFPEFFVSDYGISITDNRKEYEKKRRIDEMAGNTFSNAGSPALIMDLLKIWNAEDSTEAEAIMERGIKALEALRDQNMKAQQEQAQMEAQAKQEEQELQQQQHTEKMQNNIDVANIYANNKADDTREKETGANLRKMAEIDRDIALANSKNSENEN